MFYFDNMFIKALLIFFECFCLFIKISLLVLLYKKRPQFSRGPSFLSLMIILFTGAFTNVTLLTYLLRVTFPESIPIFLTSSLFRFELATLVLQFFALLCFFRELSSRKIASLISYWLLFPTMFFTGYYVFRVVHTFFSWDFGQSVLDKQILHFLSAYILSVGLFLLLLIYRNYKIELIKLLRQHNFTIGFYFMLPYFIVKIFESSFVSQKVNFPAATLTSLILTGMILYCFRRLAGLRFLNMRSHVSSAISEKFNFIDDFKYVLSAISNITHVEEIIPITKAFFQQAFGVPEEKLTLFLRETYFFKEKSNEDSQDHARKLFLETVLSAQSEYPEVVSFVEQHKIIIRDEVEFTHFYQAAGKVKNELEAVIEFLKKINADIFLPIYCDSRLVAYIVINHGVREAGFYTDVERDEMLIYCSHIGSVIYLLGNIDMETIVQRERELQKTLYKKERMLTLLKNGLESFVNTSRSRRVGVLTYKNKKFAYCNQAAKDLIKIDLNKDDGLQFTQSLLTVAQDTAVYLTSKRLLLTTPTGDTLIFNTSPNLERNNTIITVAYPSIADYIKDEQQGLKDPSKWDYLLMLKTTDEGALINQLIPTNTPTLSHYKILFLEAVLSHKTLIFEMAAEEDTLSFAHVTHKVKQRKVFEEIDLRSEPDEFALGLKIFGINHVFQTSKELCLLDALHAKGTLFLRNIQLLSLGLQQRLYQYIVSGKFTPLKSDEQRDADVLILCSATHNLPDFVQQGLFLKELYLELQKHAVWLPSLNSLPTEELLSLAEGMRKQLVHTKVYQNMLVFSEADQRRLIAGGCVSLHELRIKIQSIILKKTRKQPLQDHAIIDPAYNLADLDLVEAARMGRHALKDPKLLSMLLAKFKNNQNKVAQFLGVNRSTVNRRCLQFGIHIPLAPEQVRSTMN